MKKGISFFYGYKSDKNIRAKKIKEFGFDSVITSQDSRFDDQNGTIDQQEQTFNNLGLEISSLHNQYVTNELPNFWHQNAIGDSVENKIKTDIYTAEKFKIKCVVVHMLGQYSEVGEMRLKRLLETCEKTGVFLAVENINDQNLFLKIFENINHPYLKFCYDSGHNNCFDPDFDYLKNFGEKLICLHLHDNDGLGDDHTLNRFGTINWDKIAKELAEINLDNVSLDYEMLMNKHKDEVSENECLKETFEQASLLEEKINFYKNCK